MKNYASLFLASLLFVGCLSESKKKENEKITPVSTLVEKTVAKKEKNNAAALLIKKEVPILCYHNIRDFSPTASGDIKTYTVKPAAFADQMKALSVAGYHTILPEQLYEYLVYNEPLPEKPIVISFDDTRGEQYSIGETEMKKYGFKGVYFVMTVAINRPKYLSIEEIKTVSDNGNTIAAHTWDHHMVTKYTGADWDIQLVKPKLKLETIIGKPVPYFAYPFGLWNTAAIPEIKKAGYKMAFILSTKRDSVNPIFTIRRIIVSGTWTTEGMMKAINASFNKAE